MFDLLGLLFVVSLRLFRTHRSLLRRISFFASNFAVLKRKHPKPRFNLFDKHFWVTPPPILVLLEGGALSAHARDDYSLACAVPSCVQLGKIKGNRRSIMIFLKE